MIQVLNDDSMTMPRCRPLAAEATKVNTITAMIRPRRNGVVSPPMYWLRPPDRVSAPVPRDDAMPATRANIARVSINPA